MRQSQQERRIALQLLQVRQEKDVIRNNRLTKVVYLLSLNAIRFKTEQAHY